MSNLSISTLTPIHVGSGEKQLREIDFLHFKELNQVAIIDPEKVLHIIGADQVQQWVNSVDIQDGLSTLLRQRKPSLIPEDIDLRILPLMDNGMGEKSNIHEQLHDGMGRPLLPGSSIKGAIRTCLFAHFINRNYSEDAKSRSNLLDYRKNFSDTILTRKYFGSDPNHDMMRLLRLSDGTFLNTVCAKAETINLKGKDWVIDSRFTQFLEIIPEEQIANLNFNFDATTEKNAREKSNGYFKVDTSVLHQPKLFQIINQHTKDLAQREIKYWQKEGAPDEMGCYLEVLQDIVEKIQACKPGECILRLGWGTGFRNMTGDWHINMTDDDYYELLRKLRPRHPDDMPYPKSFRILADGTPLGFVKLNAT